MTNPLTPLEKVAAVVLDAADAYLIQQYGASHGLDHEVDRERIMSAIPDGAILTALASGSGDHAELASLMRLTKRLRGIAFDYIGKADRTTCIETEAANAIEALLAENAALRAMAGIADMLGEKLERRTLALDEAERKLAEAVGLLNKMVAAFCGPLTRRALGGHDERQMEATLQARMFLSKEAERG